MCPVLQACRDDPKVLNLPCLNRLVSQEECWGLEVAFWIGRKTCKLGQLPISSLETFKSLESGRVYGQRLTQTCYWAVSRNAILDNGYLLKTYHVQGAATVSGLQPEKIWFHTASEPWAYQNITIPLGVYSEEGEEEVLVKEILRGNPPGLKSGNRVYIGRPETAESVFYM